MNALKTTSEWPHHQDKHGNWVPCVKELRDNNEYIDDNPRCFHVNDDVSAYDIAHALFPDADYGDNDDTMEALNKRSEAVWHAHPS